MEILKPESIPDFTRRRGGGNNANTAGLRAKLAERHTILVLEEAEIETWVATHARFLAEELKKAASASKGKWVGVVVTTPPTFTDSARLSYIFPAPPHEQGNKS